MTVSSLLGCHAESGAHAAGAHSPPPAAIAVVVQPAAERVVRTYITGLGTVAGWQTVVVRPVVEGRLEAVHFHEGQTVRKGERLATLDLRPFDIAVHNAEGALVRDRATLSNARLNLQRNHALRGESLVSEQSVTDQHAVVEQTVGAVAVDEAALAQARYQREQADVKSPIDGVLGVRQLDVGNLVRLSDANGLVVVTQLDPAAVVFTLPEHARLQVHRAMARGSVLAEAYARNENAPLARGEVRVVDNQMAQGSGTVRFKAALDNPNQALWPGQFVKLRLRLESLAKTPVVPAAAVQRDADGEYVYVVDATGKAQVRPIERLPLLDGVVSCSGNDEASCGDDVPLVRGPHLGERVVVDGQLRLRPGAEVRVRPDGAAAPK